MRVLRRLRQQLRDVREQTRDVCDVWRVERDIDAAAAGRGPLIVGPWMSEVGYEVLYWIPFLRWFQRAYRIPRERVVAVSRGGVAGWYADVAAHYVDVFTCVDPGAVVERLQGSPGSSGSSKQLVLDEFDARIVDAVSEREKLSNPAVVHPSLMYRLFRSFWSGRASAGFIDRYTRFSRVEPDVPPLAGLPAEYIAVKFYTARSLPDTSETRSALASLVASLAERMPVVVLDTGLRLDDHDDFAFDRGTRVISLREHMQPHDNLAVQTRAIAGARAFVGTCGSLAWLAPLLGVDTIPVFSDSKLLHAHLQVAWRAYHRVEGAGAFSPCDIGGLTRLGVGLGSTGAALEGKGARVGAGVGKLPR